MHKSNENPWPITGGLILILSNIWSSKNIDFIINIVACGRESFAFPCKHSRLSHPWSTSHVMTCEHFYRFECDFCLCRDSRVEWKQDLWFSPHVTIWMHDARCPLHIQISIWFVCRVWCSGSPILYSFCPSVRSGSDTLFSFQLQLSQSNRSLFAQFRYFFPIGDEVVFSIWNLDSNKYWNVCCCSDGHTQASTTKKPVPHKMKSATMKCEREYLDSQQGIRNLFIQHFATTASQPASQGSIQIWPISQSSTCSQHIVEIYL